MKTFVKLQNGDLPKKINFVSNPPNETNLVANTKKRPFENSKCAISTKKSKFAILDQQKCHLPNEMWIKIVNLLPTYDVFRNFALVNKHFHSLTLSPSSIKYLNIYCIFDDDHFEEVIKVIKRSNTLNELSIDFCPDYWKRLIIPALEASKNLKSLKVSMDTPDFQWECRYDLEQTMFLNTLVWDGRMEIPPIPYLTLGPKLMKMITKRKRLQILEIRGLCIKPEVTMLISQMKSLKSLEVSHNWLSLVNPEMIQTLAMNSHRLEKIVIRGRHGSIWGCICKDYEEAFKTLIENNRSTLKIVKINMCTKCKLLENVCLTSGKILEEFNGQIVERGAEMVSKFQTLKKLRLVKIYPHDFQTIFSGKISLTNLKYLSIDFAEPYVTERIFREISGNHFPALERLYVHSDPSKYNNKPLLLKTFTALITENLKSIQIDGGCVSNTHLSKKDLYQFFKETKIFIIFGKVKKSKMSERQKCFEELLRQDEITLKRYLMEKQKFALWCKSNPGYGYLG